MTQKTPNLVERPPIVVVMGHVDHGKSTLLDFLRKSNVVAGEAGGITQHVAAYEVEHEHEGKLKRMTFIDTPGHAAFKTIRARGANVADIAILVIAADDGVKAQTLEALESIKSSGTPFIVAINKIDKPNADVDRTKYSLLEHGVYLEGLGGDIPFAPISAKNGTGIPELLDLVLISAELAELKADPDAPAEGFVIEAHRDEKRGIAATLIITNGSVQTGMAVVAGSSCAPLRLFESQAGKSLKSASFSTPIQVFGFNELPAVGSIFTSYQKRKDAEDAATKARAALENAHALDAQTGGFVIPLIIKADTTGSLEAIVGEVEKINTAESRYKIVSTGLGPISENDIKAAVASPEGGAVVAAFTVAADRNAIELARQSGITIEYFDIIYKLTEHLAAFIKERKPLENVQEVLGSARLLKFFSSKRDEHIVGGKVETGTIGKGAKFHLVRKGEILGMGEVVALQAARQQVDKVTFGDEFGAQIACDVAPEGGDVLETYRVSQR